MKPKTSDIWRYFIPVNADFAKCKICQNDYSRKGRTTTSLKSHLKSKHKEKFEQFCKIVEQREIGRVTGVQEMEKSNETAVRPQQQVKLEMALEEEPTEINQTWDISLDETKDTDDLISEMIALEYLPFNFVEGIGFRRLIQATLPNHQIKSRQFYTNHICDEIYTKMATKVSQMLKQFPKLSFTTDIWCEPDSDVSLLNLTAHGITENFTRKEIVLKCASLHGTYTGEIISEHLKMILQEWNIDDEQIHCLTHDGGNSNIDDLNCADVICTIHKLKLCAHSALENREVKNIIAKSKTVTDHFNNSQTAQDELIKIQTEQLNQPALCVFQDCFTRWNSTYHMIERLLRIKRSICLYSNRHNIPQFSPEEWLSVCKIVAILGPFEEIVTTLSDSNTCISSVIPLIYVLRHTLSIERDKSDTNQSLKNMIQKVIEDVNRIFCDLSRNKLYLLATYLDPRYKSRLFDDITKKLIESELLRLLMLHDMDLDVSQDPLANGVSDEEYGASIPKRCKIELDLDDEPSKSFQNLPPTQSIISALADLLNDSSDDEDETENTSNVVMWKALIKEYNKESRLQLEADPLIWWKRNTKFQVFAPIVRTYLSPPPGLVPIKQLFNGAGSICELLRNSPESDKVAKQLFVKNNLRLLNFDY